MHQGRPIYWAVLWNVSHRQRDSCWMETVEGLTAKKKKNQLHKCIYMILNAPINLTVIYREKSQF